MYKVHIPSMTLYVTPEQLPRILANLAETRYVNEVGEFLQTTTWHEPSIGETTATILVRSPLDTVQKESEQYKDMWKKAQSRAERAEARLAKKKGK